MDVTISKEEYEVLKKAKEDINKIFNKFKTFNIGYLVNDKYVINRAYCVQSNNFDSKFDNTMDLVISLSYNNEGE